MKPSRYPFQIHLFLFAEVTIDLYRFLMARFFIYFWILFIFMIHLYKFMSKLDVTGCMTDLGW